MAAPKDNKDNKMPEKKEQCMQSFKFHDLNNDFMHYIQRKILRWNIQTEI